jgi:hypothetical protein
VNEENNFLTILDLRWTLCVDTQWTQRCSESRSLDRQWDESHSKSGSLDASEHMWDVGSGLNIYTAHSSALIRFLDMFSTSPKITSSTTNTSSAPILLVTVHTNRILLCGIFASHHRWLLPHSIWYPLANHLLFQKHCMQMYVGSSNFFSFLQINSLLFCKCRHFDFYELWLWNDLKFGSGLWIYS